MGIPLPHGKYLKARQVFNFLHRSFESTVFDNSQPRPTVLYQRYKRGHLSERVIESRRSNEKRILETKKPRLKFQLSHLIALVI